MYRFSNTLIGFLNLFTLIASIPIIGGALWMARNSTSCESFLQTPLLVVGFVVLIVSLAGFIGACFNVGWALWVYLVVMLLLIGTLLSFTIFGFVVTSEGGGVDVVGRVYKEYKLEDYSPWLRKRIEQPGHWRSVRSCILGSTTCSNLASWTPIDYLEKDMSPVQSGCCKPPTSCNYAVGSTAQESDCYRWNNAFNVLCYECDSCKAGVLEDIRGDWHKLSVLNVVVLVFLISIYSIGCCAFRNTRRSEGQYPYAGHNRMSKVGPRWDYYWWRWWHDRRDQLY